MYGRFTDRARKVMQLADQEAQRFNHEYIGTEHILLGLIKEGSGVAANVLKNLDVDPRKIRLEVEKLVLSGPGMLIMGKLPQTPRAKKVIEYSMEEARNLNHNYVGTEHILLGLLREDGGVAAKILMNVGLNLGRVREEVRRLHGGAASSEAPAVGAAAQRVDEGEPPAECPKCGHRHVVRVLRDFIHLFGNDERDVEAGRAILGGRSGAILPAWVCLDCQPRWSEVHRMALQDLQWDRAKEQAVAATNFEEAARIRDAQAGWRQQLRVLVEALLAEKTP